MVPGTSVRSGNDSLLNALISVIQALIFIFRSVELRCPCTPPPFSFPCIPVPFMTHVNCKLSQ